MMHPSLATSAVFLFPISGKRAFRLLPLAEKRTVPPLPLAGEGWGEGELGSPPQSFPHPPSAPSPARGRRERMRVRTSLFAFVCYVFATAATADERILDFASDIAIASDASMTVAETIRVRAEGNRALDSGDHEAALRHAGEIRAMMGILGCDPLDERWETRDETSAALAAVDVLVRAQLADRDKARQQRNWALADEIRDRLKAAGIEVTDTADGPQWMLQADNGK